jgi:hypothetical protein
LGQSGEGCGEEERKTEKERLIHKRDGFLELLVSWALASRLILKLLHEKERSTGVSPVWGARLLGSIGFVV